MIDVKKKTVRRVRVKKARPHAAHHGGSWKVAYADFVTAMMALFLVLWLVSQGDHKLKASIANYFRTPGAFNTTSGNVFDSKAAAEEKLTTAMATKDDEKALYSTAALLRKKLSKLAGNDQVRIDMTEEGLHIQILDKADEVSFPLGSAEMSPTTRGILGEIAAGICELPNAIQIGGHTDSYTFPGSGYSNWELSADRANAARRELEADCVQPGRIRRIVGYADTRPLVPETPYAPANRRISIMLLWQKTVEANPKIIEEYREDTAGSAGEKP
jgi:chemotaxis protein MotB